MGRTPESMDLIMCPSLPRFIDLYPGVSDRCQIGNNISRQISGLPEGLVTQVSVKLGHGRGLVSQELLQDIKIDLAMTLPCLLWSATSSHNTRRD